MTESIDRVPVPASEFFGDRVSHQYRDHYHLIASVFNGVVRAGAAISLLLILSTPEPAGPRAAALGLWPGSLGSLICTYNGPLVNSMLIARPPNLVDVVIPFLVGVMGFAQFALIAPLRPALAAPTPTASAQLDHLTWWFLSAAALWAIVIPNLLNTLAQARATENEAPADLAPLIRWCQAIIQKAVRGTIGITVTLLVAFWLMRRGPQRIAVLDRLPASASLRRWQGEFGIAYFAGMVALILIQERARRVMAASVSGDVPMPDSGSEVIDQ